jgi:hypothetical protein
VSRKKVQKRVTKGVSGQRKWRIAEYGKEILNGPGAGLRMVQSRLE